jgi:hypothetical protein
LPRPPRLPKNKVSKLGLYLEAKEVPAFLRKHAPKVLFVDLRTPEEQLFVGVPEGIDGTDLLARHSYTNVWQAKPVSARSPFDRG